MIVAAHKVFPPQFCYQIISFVDMSLQAASFLVSENYFVLVVTLGRAGWMLEDVLWFQSTHCWGPTMLFVRE